MGWNLNAQMRGVGIIKTPAPNPYTHFHLQETWAMIEEIPSPPLTVAEFTCGPAEYKADPRDWWKAQGVPLVHDIYLRGTQIAPGRPRLEWFVH